MFKVENTVAIAGFPVMRRQELVCAADSEVEAVIAYRNALENALLQPAAAHPVESFGAANLSLAQAGSHDERVCQLENLLKPCFFLPPAAIMTEIYNVLQHLWDLPRNA